MKCNKSLTFKTTIYSAIFLAMFCILLGQSEDAAGALMANWKLDEGSGDTIEDSSGEGHDGEFAEGDPQWVPGIGGTALEFDGDDYVVIDAWITETGMADFSITAWVKTETTGVSFLVKNNEDRVLDMHEKLFYVGDQGTSEGGMTGAVEWVGHSCDWIRGSNTDVADGEWHHVAVTWNFASMDGHIYVDGEEGTSHMGYNGGADIDGNIWKIGFTSGWPGGIDYVGAVDDIRIFDEELAEDDIVQIMEEQGGFAVSPTGKLPVTWGVIKEQ